VNSPIDSIWSLKVHPEKCTGCNQCVLICSFTKTGMFNPHNALLELLSWEQHCLVVPIVCAQCEDRPCAEACPENAIEVDPEKGILYVNHDLCTACELCFEACPTGSIILHPNSELAVKCDLCSGQPACVEVCYPEALVYELMSWSERQIQLERQVEARRTHRTQELPSFPINVKE
jgi:Fe-S-cluster-containing hydrogenase component 2